MLITMRRDDTINMLRLPMKTVVPELVSNVQQHERTARHAHAQSRDIDERVGLVPEQIAYSYFEVVFEHVFSLHSAKRMAHRAKRKKTLCAMPSALRYSNTRLATPSNVISTGRIVPSS